ncbi:transcription factor Sp2-like [Nymphalis io]|uniref:transcription factor Sp2-like n=1 Tax=Inachis io TaxID=171585 RepID=UPI0021692EB8|nr:transcription factor Sp2-like [Nymphalis io]
MVNQEDFIDAKKSASTRGPRIRKRFPCTCPCCKDGVKLFFDGQRKHLCHYPDCGRVFIKKNHLVVHLRSHSGEKPYTCNFKLCGKRFSRSDELSRHKRIHSGEKIHKCPECPKSFTRSDHLTKHIRIHATKPEELEEPEIIYIKSEPKNEENDIFIMEEDRLE